jgi:hypothetical protein
VIRHDFRCTKCKFQFEVVFDCSDAFRREWPCVNCSGVAHQVWLRAPGLAGVSEPSTRGVSRSFEPGWDVQSGKYFNDRAERDKYVKGRGLELMGPKEWDRTMKALPDPTSREPDRATLEEAAEKSWQRLQAGERPEPMEPFKPESTDIASE